MLLCKSPKHDFSNKLLQPNAYVYKISVSNYLFTEINLCSDLTSILLQIITTLEEDSTAQKMQLGYRLQQIAAAVENKVTDL